MDQLDSEENELLASYELSEWKPVAELEAEMRRYREYARATLNEDQSTNERKRIEERRHL